MSRSLKKIHLPTLDSTQLWAKRHYTQMPLDTLLCIDADEQTSGIGTHDRSWVSPSGVNIYTTCVFSLPRSFRFLANLSQVISLSCIQVLSEMGFHPQCKWPNDLLIDGKKMAGILTDIVSTAENSVIFIGMGLNVNMEKENCEKLDQPVTSLFLESGKKWDKSELLDKLLLQINQDITLLETEGFIAFKSLYENHVLYLHKPVVITQNDHSYSGAFVGIDDLGRLILKTEGGEKMFFSSAERMVKA